MAETNHAPFPPASLPKIMIALKVRIVRKRALASGFPTVAKRGLFSAWMAILFSVGGHKSLAAIAAVEADAIFDAHTKAFYHVENGRGWHRKNTEGGKADFWMQAEMLEMVLDVYARTKSEKELEMFDQLFHGFIARHGRNWSRNEFNDDIMWMVIACTRAHLITKNAEYLSVAKENFDLCYSRAISPDLGGGLWWKTDNKSKNACVNGPGAIAANLLGRATKDSSYQNKAKELYLWQRATLFDPKTGRVSDAINRDKRINRMALTYNQGTFVGAANLLGFHDDAKLAALFTMNELCKDGYLPAYGEEGDGGGFNGIGVRWIARYMKNRSEQATFEPWLLKNAEAAWQSRRVEDNLSSCAWPKPTQPGLRYSWACSNAVVILQALCPQDPVHLPKKK
jgi:predicted alpha-1,6-mannanase (GH76 family)